MRVCVCVYVTVIWTGEEAFILGIWKVKAMRRRAGKGR